MPRSDCRQRNPFHPINRVAAFDQNHWPLWIGLGGRIPSKSLAALPRIPQVASELRQHHLSQAQELLRLGVRQTDATFVYTRQDGAPMQPRSLSQMWASFSTQLPRIRFHDLRHAHATHMLSAGVHPKVASSGSATARLGSRLISTAMSYRGCKRTRLRALTQPIKSRKRNALKTLGSKAVAFADFGSDRPLIYANNFNGLERWQSG